MRDNKGQVLIIFVLFLPIFIIFLCYVFDISRVTYEENKLKSIANMTLEYVKEKNLTDNTKIEEYIKKNDKNTNINITNNGKVKIELTKEIKSLFSGYIGKDKYTIKAIVE